MTLTDTDRARLRAKQDFLIMLVVDMAGMPEDLRIDEGGPTLADTRAFIYPEWETRLNGLLRHWAGEQRPVVGLPDWEAVVDHVINHPELHTLIPAVKPKYNRQQKKKK